VTRTLTVRSYRDDDEPAVLELLRASLGGGPAGERSPAFFRWKHVANPFGRSFMLVAEDGGRIVGLRAFMRWEFRAGEGVLRAVRAVDTATHPDHQGRGIFSRLTRDAVSALRGEVDLVFNTPNAQSGPGYLKMGWREVGRLPVSVRPRRPLRFMAGVRSLRGPARPSSPPPVVEAEPALEALADGAGVAELLDASIAPEPRITTRPTVGFLRWRYGDAPGLGYRAVVAREGGRVRGIAFFRVRPRGRLWETAIADVIVPRGARDVARSLLSAVRRAAAVDHLTALFAPGTVQASAARRGGFVPAPGGPPFVVNPLRDGIVPDPTRIRSWAAPLGDLEVF
jgi:GNAT superfamily N-acetyltransferase